MNREQRVEMYSEYLRREGYHPELTAQGHIRFKKEGKIYLILVYEDDKEYFQLVFPNFWPLENETERGRAIGAALHATSDTKVAKIYPTGDNMSGSVEMFCTPPEVFEPVFNRCLSALDRAVHVFAQAMRA